MALNVGARIGPYEVTGTLGVGGMGEVYRARDSRLGRDVALKVLPDVFADDADRLARFQREAQVLAALNHPHIAGIYGLEESPADVGAGFSRPIRALVLELVEGETLAEYIAGRAGPSGPAGIPLDEALPIARQIAEALEAAHEQGIIHRDLKPANVKVTPDGLVKVLDFGLAKLSEAGVPAGLRQADATASLTITSPVMMTGVGTILGTAAYMAPEQAKGRPADKRSDVWAFGCVMYEMLTGRRAFDGDDVQDTLVAVLRDEPNWAELPRDTPPEIRKLLRRCAEKDRRKRLPDIGAARLDIDDALAEPTAAAATPVLIRRSRLPWIVAGVTTVLALTTASAYLMVPRGQPPDSLRFELPVPAAVRPVTGATLAIALSPDGRRVALTVESRAGAQRSIAVRAFNEDDMHVLAGTDDGSSPFWSPDSRTIAFFADGKLKKIDAGGGPAQVIAALPVEGTPARGGTWGPDGTIVFGLYPGALFRVAAGGGSAIQLTHLDAAKKELFHTHPWFLPDGRHFLYYAGSSVSSDDTGGIFAGSLDDADKTPVAAAESMAVYADGHILFTREGTLLAQSFDSRRLVTDGDPVVIATDITVQGNRAAMFSVSRSGLLVVRSASLPPTQLTVVDRGGRRLRTVGEPADMTEVALSPDDTRAVVSIRDPSKQTRDLWVQDLVRDVRTRLTFDPGDDQQPAWSPDGTRVLFSAARPARLDLYERMTDGSGSERQVFAFDSLRLNSYATSWSPDSRYILFYNGTVESPTGSNDIQVLATSGERAPRPFLQTRFSEEDGQFSPDGRWIAYKSNESGRYEVYVVPFPGPAGKWKVSTAGGETPRWRRDGKELFFLSGTAMVSANVNGSGNTFAVGRSQRLFDAHLGDRDNVEHSYGVFADGQRFLIALVAADQPAEAPIRVITNWTSLLQKTK